MAQKKLERLTSIAITLPGIIDTENGIVHRMPFYEDVKEMPLGEALEQHTGVPVYIQHDISAWTMAEALFGASRGARDVIQVVIDHNVGAGVITDGHLLHAGSSSLMRVLGIETSCDETGIAIYDDEKGLLANQLYSQVKLHADYGGVVPELASRDHVRKTVPLLKQGIVWCTSLPGNRVLLSRIPVFPDSNLLLAPAIDRLAVVS